MGNPTWKSEDGSIQLYLGDCLTILPMLDEESVDAIILDPPYGINFKYNSHNDTPEEYGDWIWKVAEQCEKKARPGSPIFIWQAMPNIRNFSKWFPREWRLFAACKNFVQIRQIPMQYSFDPVIVWWKSGGKPWAKGTSSRDFHVANTSPSNNTGLNRAKGHPCPRPLGTLHHIIDQWVMPQGIVLDCCMGSGTTGVACVITRNRFIGMEINKDYFDLAVARISNAIAQPSLEMFGVSNEQTAY